MGCGVTRAVWQGLRGATAATAAAAVAAVIVAASGARAQDKPKSIWQQDTLTGDWGGARSALSDRGINIDLSYTNDVLSIVSGGLQKRGVYDGLVEFRVNTDLQKLVGWTGGRTQVSVFQIQNTKGGIAEYAGSIADPSSIDARQTTRLFTAWFEQSFGHVRPHHEHYFHCQPSGDTRR